MQAEKKLKSAVTIWDSDDARPKRAAAHVPAAHGRSRPQYVRTFTVVFQLLLAMTSRAPQN